MKTVVIGDYEIHTPTVGMMPNFFGMMQSDPDKLTEEMFRNCVFKDGEPLGDRIKDVPVGISMKIVTELVTMSGLNKEGNG